MPGWKVVKLEEWCLLHRLDADDLKAQVEQFNLERDFLARFEGIVHRFFRHSKRHRHRAHKSGDRVMFDHELAISDFLNCTAADKRIRPRAVGRRGHLAGCFSRRRRRFRFTEAATMTCRVIFGPADA